MWPPSLLAAKTTGGSRAAGARDEIINSLLRRRFWRLASQGSRGVVYTAYLTSFQKEGMNNISFFSTSTLSKLTVKYFYLGIH